jgi:hypothetical protein
LFWCWTLSLFVHPMGTKYRNHVFYVWFVDLQTICGKYRLETRISPNDGIRKYLLDKQHSWTKNAFWDVKKWNDINGVNLFLLSYLITLMAYLCSQWAPYVQIKYFMSDWSNYRLFVLNRGWRRNSLEDDIRICLLDIQFRCSKNAIWNLNSK